MALAVAVPVAALEVAGGGGGGGAVSAADSVEFPDAAAAATEAVAR